MGNISAVIRGGRISTLLSDWLKLRLYKGDLSEHFALSLSAFLLHSTSASSPRPYKAVKSASKSVTAQNHKMSGAAPRPGSAHFLRAQQLFRKDQWPQAAEAFKEVHLRSYRPYLINAQQSAKADS